MSRYSHEDIVNRLKDFCGDDLELLEKYKGKLSLEHKLKSNVCGHEFTKRLNIVFRGSKKLGHRCQKCRNKTTPQEITKKIEDKYKGSIELLEPYTTVKAKALFKCNVCNHEWYACISDILRERTKKGCYNCTNKQRSYSKMISHEEVLLNLSTRTNNNIIILDKQDNYRKDGMHLFYAKDCNHTFTARLRKMLTKRSICAHKECMSKYNSKNKKKKEDAYLEDLVTLDRGWELVEPLKDYTKKHKHRCLCCGHIQQHIPSKLRSYPKKCNKCQPNRSLGEIYFEELLDSNNILYETEKIYDDLRGRSNHLRFDFYFPDKNILVEIQGKQHFQPVSYFGEEDHKKLIENDDKKKQYCENNNILLIEIPYLNGTDDKDFQNFCEHAINIITLS